MTGPDAPLLVELVPKTAWGSNLRSVLTAAQWKLCQQYVYRRSGRVCEICGGRGERWPVECHEIWAYDDEALLQTLTGLIALCPRCHSCKHAGFSESQGRIGEVIEHLMQVNGWDARYTQSYLEWVFKVWAIRSEYPWHLETDWLITNLNIPGGLTLSPDRKA